MNVIDSVMNLFRRGGAKMGVVGTLNKITDHPRIGVSEREYDRIRDDLRFFKGDFPMVKYKNTYGLEQTRDYISLNMAQVLVRRMSSILVNEQMTFVIGKDGSPADVYAHRVLDNNGFIKNFERYLESALALGGLAMRPYYDAGSNTIKIAWIQAPVFYPLQSNGNDVSEAAIATKTTTTERQKTIYWTLLEFHSWNGDEYVIDNELYRSEDATQVGVPQSLTALDIYADLEPHATVDNLTRPLFVYMKPFGFNNKDIMSPLGLSIYDNARNTLQQINDTYDQFNWEIKMGQRRVMVPESLTTVHDERGTGYMRQFFDTDQSVFVGMAGGIDENGGIKDLTTDIRTEQYVSAMNQFIKTLEMQVGLSTGTFSFDAQGLKTATEVVSENSMTYQTRNSHLNNVERAIQELIISVLELGKSYDLYNGDIPTLNDVQLNFDDGVFLDKTAQLDYYAKAVAAGLYSKKRTIETVFDVTDEDAEKILAEIQSESQGPLSPQDNLMYGQATGDDD